MLMLLNDTHDGHKTKLRSMMYVYFKQRQRQMYSALKMYSLEWEIFVPLDV